MTKIIINGPPLDRCCEVCGVNIEKLTPFGKAGDPLMGDFDGQLLLKNFRTMAPKMTDEELQDYYNEYGEENANIYEQLMCTVEASWECRNCFVLNDKEIFDKRHNKQKGD